MDTSTYIPTYPVTLVSTTPINEKVTIYRFKFDQRADFHFLPGQYIWLILNNLSFPDPRGNRRAFSIASSNQDSSHIDILTQKSESGFKKTLDLFSPGDSATIIGPFGSSFTIPQDSQANVTFITRGISISPFRSIISSFSEPPTHRIQVIHCASTRFTPFDITTLIPNIHHFNIPLWEISKDFNESVLPNNLDYKQEQFCVTGSQTFVNTVGEFLNSKQAPPEHQHYEENYPEPEGNLTESALNKEANSIMMRAINDSYSHTVITDANGKILFANPVVEKTTGYCFSEIRGKLHESGEG